MENDASLAKHICGVGYSYRRRVEKICRSVSLINEAVRTISKVIIAELSVISKGGLALQTVIKSVGQQLSLMIQFQKVCQSFVVALPNPPEDKGSRDKVDSMGQLADLQQTEFRNLSGHLLTLEQPIKQLHGRFVENGVLMGEWEEVTSVRLCIFFT